MNKIDHLGIAVASLAQARACWQMLGFQFQGEEVVESEGVRVDFSSIGESNIELLEATRPDSPIASFLAKRGPGIHHLCVEVQDLDATLAEYKARGVRMIHERPILGAGGCRCAFVHPHACSGVLLELKEKP